MNSNCRFSGSATIYETGSKNPALSKTRPPPKTNVIEWEPSKLCRMDRNPVELGAEFQGEMVYCCDFGGIVLHASRFQSL